MPVSSRGCGLPRPARRGAPMADQREGLGSDRYDHQWPAESPALLRMIIASGYPGTCNPASPCTPTASPYMRRRHPDEPSMTNVARTRHFNDTVIFGQDTVIFNAGDGQRVVQKTPG